MKEDLNLYGNQYNYIVVAWTVGYIVGQWVCFFFLYSNSVRRSHSLMQPSNFILTRVRAHSKPLSENYCFGTIETYLTVFFSVWIPFLEIGWTIFTFSLAGAKTYHQMLGLRFVVGLFEAGYWPALYYILGSWYNKRKLFCLIIEVFNWDGC